MNANKKHLKKMFIYFIEIHLFFQFRLLIFYDIYFLQKNIVNLNPIFDVVLMLIQIDDVLKNKMLIL